MKTRIIVLPDSHSKPFKRRVQNPDGHWHVEYVSKLIANRRYDWLADYIIDQIKTLAPDETLYVMDLGDFMDLKSLSSYDKGKGEAELERLELDIDFGRDARTRLMQPVLDYLEHLKVGHRRVPRVQWVCLLGNHENRWARFRGENPAWVDFDGLPDDLSRASSLGAEVVPFLVPKEIAGIHFCHYYYKKDSRYAIGGVTPARALMTFLKKSAVSGHTHEWDVHGATTIVGTIRCLYAGCYYEHDEKYPGPQGHSNITRAITVLHDCEDGAYNEVKIPIQDLKEKYIRPEHGALEWAQVVADIPYTVGE